MIDENMSPPISTYSFRVLLTLLCVLLCLNPSQGQAEEKTYSISLEKTAVVAQDIHEVDDKKVLAQEYVIQDGDYLWKILRQKGLLRRRDLPELLSALKKLNKSLRNLNLVHPGEKIIIPLKITPSAGTPQSEVSSREEITTVATLEELDFENYTVRRGDSLIRIVKGRYTIPPKELHQKYLGLVKKLNPSIKDLDIIHPRQVVRLPIYSPQIVREPIEHAIPQRPGGKGTAEKAKGAPSPLTHALSEIFSEMGEEWVQTGEHFIPLKSGGQIDLKAKSFPIINLHTGLRVILDLHNKLPEKMARLIESDWENYRVVRLAEIDDPSSALDKILRVCNYLKIVRKGPPLELKGDIAFSITGDWIIKLSETPSHNRPGVIVINLNDPPTPHTPQMIKNYLARLGVKVIEYPPSGKDTLEDMKEVQKLGGDGDPFSLVRTLLSLTGHSFTTRVEIPVNQSQKADFKLIVNADFFLNIKGQDAIIDLTGLAPEVISFLREHQFLILSLAAEKEALAMLSKTLDFLGVQSDPGPHPFLATKGDASKNITLSFSGIVFFDAHGRSILATPLNLPDEIMTFLAQRGYQVFVLASS